MSNSTDREIMTIEEAAALLGVSVKTFNKVLHTQSLPARKIGREWKFSRRALIDWIGSGRSVEFYREGSEAPETPEILDVPAASNASAGQVNGVSPRAAEGGHRTSGWRLELD